jgi:brefeldin A-inhibited guanine nucleotide-exchange protein
MDSAKVGDDDSTPAVGTERPVEDMEDDVERKGPGSSVGAELVVSGTDRFFVPLKLACESKLPRLMDVALACIQKLIAYGYVRGKEVQVGKMRRQLMDVVMETICACKDQEDELVQLQIVKAVLTAVTSTVSAVHETTLLLAVKTCFYIYLVSRTPVIQTTANATLTQMLNVVFQRLEFGGGQSVVSPAALSVIQRDAFLVFRSLCKLSMKPLPENLVADDSIELRSKLLSLQLLFSIIQNSGTKFRSGDKFVWAVRQYLCVSLLKNGVSPIASILQLSLDLFVAVIRFFKDHLKSEIGVFFSNILLRILESTNSSLVQKQLTVQCLRTLVKEPQLIVDLFLNYDCDLDHPNIMATISDGLSRLTTSLHTLTEPTDEDKHLKGIALETLVAISDSMVAWERETRGEVAKPSAVEEVERDDSTVVSPSATAGKAAAGETAAAASSPAAEGGALVPAGKGVVRDLEASFHRKNDVQEGIVKFNMKPKKGLKYLTDVCGLENTPAAIAQFLLTSSGLDKRAVGDFLGEGDEFNKSVLYAYVDAIDFAGLTFDAALRKFLSHFWMPGEAQKIDRMMEKFAQRYCSQNDEKVFANADTAYVLAYSLIMLNTDAHSSQIKKKMTQQEFVNMNRGINDSKDLPSAFLEQLYQGITTNEIKIKEFDPVAEHAKKQEKEGRSTSAPINKTKLFNLESAAMVKESQEAFKLKAKSKTKFVTSKDAEAVRPMFESTWCAMLAACSAVMDDQPTEPFPPIVGQAIRGFENAIHVAADFGMQTERDAFITMLVKFTYLDSTKTMGKRNIESFKALVQVALRDGNGLGASWGPVFKCLSEFQRLYMIGTGAKTDAQILTGPARPSSAPASSKKAEPAAAASASRTSSSSIMSFGSSKSLAVMQQTRPRQSTVSTGQVSIDLAAVDALNSETMLDKVDVVAIDRIFSSSEQLSPEAIVHFVNALTAVSREELSDPTNPQVYSLQKLVEIAHYNMNRVRFVWARIWEVLGEFFTEVGQHPNYHFAMYAVDSLRQLSHKFLEKGELLNFAFQREFLKPFVDLMGPHSALEIRELILGCLENMILSRAKNIKSGWTPMFSVFSLAAQDAAASVAQPGFKLAQHIIAEHSALIGGQYTECAACLGAYLHQPHHEQLAVQAAQALVTFARVLSKITKEVSPSASSGEKGEAPGSPRAESASSSSSMERDWWALLGALLQGVHDRRPAVRGAALQAMFTCLNLELGTEGVLQGEVGRSAYRTFVVGMYSVLPVEPPAVAAGEAATASAPAAAPAPTPEAADWLATTGVAALSESERCFCRHSKALGSGLLDELVTLLVRCLQQTHTPALAHTAAEALLHLVKETGAAFSQDTWKSVCAELKGAFVGAGPYVAPSPPVEAKGDTKLVAEVSQRVQKEAPPGSGPREMQTLLLSTVHQLLLLNHKLMKIPDLEGLLNSMHESYEKAHHTVMDAVGGAEVSKTELDEAITLEVDALSYYSQILFTLFAKLTPGAKLPTKGTEPPLGSEAHILLIGAAAEYRLVSFCLHVMREYLAIHKVAGDAKSKHAALAQRLLTTFTPSVETLLQQIMQWHDSQFARHLPGFYPLFVDLMHCDSKELRQILRDIFANRVGDMVNNKAPAS